MEMVPGPETAKLDQFLFEKICSGPPGVVQHFAVQQCGAFQGIRLGTFHWTGGHKFEMLRQNPEIAATRKPTFEEQV